MQAFSQRMGTWGWRLNAFVLALCLVTIVHSAANSNAPANVDGARDLARHTGDLSDHALKSMIAGLDPTVAAIASRYDPGLPKAPQSHAPGWPTYDLTYTPLFDLKGLDAEEAKRVNELTPGLREIEPAVPFVLQAKLPAERERAVRCMTNAIYYEAALESVDGQRAVAQVVLNRVRDPNFPKSICGVVYEGWERATGCQFSFTCDNALLRAPMAPYYQNSRKVAEAALAGYVMGEVGTATHYHADYVAPYWGPTLVKVKQIGAHIFYRWPGMAGQLASFVGRYVGGETKLSEAVLTGRAPRPNLPPPEHPGAVQLLMASAGPATLAASDAPLIPGRRRKATPEDIARINDLLARNFPLQPSASAAAPTPAVPVAATSAAAAPAS